MFSSFSPLNLSITPVEHTASSRRFADCSAGVVHPSRQVCCNATCGLCGGHGCSGRPGGPRECCMPAILRTGRVCESRADVACILRGSSNYIRGDGVEHRGSSGEGFPRAPPPPLPSPQAHAQTQTNLGTNVTPALSHDVEAAIAAHLNVSTLSTAKFGMPTGEHVLPMSARDLRNVVGGCCPLHAKAAH